MGMTVDVTSYQDAFAYFDKDSIFVLQILAVSSSFVLCSAPTEN